MRGKPTLTYNLAAVWNAACGWICTAKLLLLHICFFQRIFSFLAGRNVTDALAVPE